MIKKTIVDGAQFYLHEKVGCCFVTGSPKFLLDLECGEDGRVLNTPENDKVIRAAIDKWRVEHKEHHH